MCGRYASTRSAADLAALFDAHDETAAGLGADYNIAPTDPVAIVRRSASTGSRVLSVGRWGLVPPWARDTSGAARLINARAETVATSRAFAPSFAQRRCLVPAHGWYEWVARRPAQHARSHKQPYFMTRTDGDVLAFGGIWSTWVAGSERRLTVSIVTIAAEGGLERIHDRMPLLLDPDRWESWLNATDATGLLVAPAREYVAGIELRPVSAAVGDVRNDGPDLVRAVAAPMSTSTVELKSTTLF